MFGFPFEAQIKKETNTHFSKEKSTRKMHRICATICFLTQKSFAKALLGKPVFKTAAASSQI